MPGSIPLPSFAALTVPHVTSATTSSILASPMLSFTGKIQIYKIGPLSHNAALGIHAMDSSLSHLDLGLTRTRKLSENNRYSARYLILVYAKTSGRFDPLEIQRLVSREQAQCTIVLQSLDSDAPNYLAFIDFSGKRFQTRNLKMFDIQGHHPRWVRISSSPWRTLDEIMQRGDVVWKGITRKRKIVEPSEPPARKSLGSRSTSSEWEMVGSLSDETAFLSLCKSQMPQETFENVMKQIETPKQTRKDRVDVPSTVEYWQAGYREGFRDALAHMNQKPRHESSSSQAPEHDLVSIAQPQIEVPTPYQSDETLSASDSQNSTPFSLDSIMGDIAQIPWEWD
ncbi:hypothetical protein K491DRAFT_763250 [Lophiostoma macrostomum CBS 122681]|uniref:Uncharacterized protein n=1 Tax=Lophiostoma macrostomum CBS 122681 TaxID=1314788 RepID=A0A6A6SNG4_9PLEO|nr:hypothetical protein K491DRAFT_763250 [Lophiostoma macrostomum CBS 122681]